MVSWMSPDDGDLVRGYMVGYGEGVPDVNWRYVDAASNNVTIGNLSTCQTRPRDSCAFTHLYTSPDYDACLMAMIYTLSKVVGL